MSKKSTAKRAKKATPQTRQKAIRRNWSADTEPQKEARTLGTRTIKANGALGTVESHAEPVPEPERIVVGEAIRQALERLGPITVEDSLAPQQMRELGDCLETVERAKAIFLAKAEDAKSAKKALDAARETLEERVKTFTHLPPLPLFDQAEAEEDRAAMLAGGEVEELGQEATH